MELASNGAGAILRTARERQGRDTAAIAQELRILQRFVVAIESDDLKNLPGGFYYKSFVRQYAAILGVDEMVIHRGIDSLLATLNPLPLPGMDSNQPRPVKPIVRKAKRSLSDSYIVNTSPGFRSNRDGSFFCVSRMLNVNSVAERCGMSEVVHPHLRPTPCYF